MTATVPDAPPTATPGRRVSRAAVAEALLVLLLAAAAVVALYQQAQRQSFSVDESRWISTSRYFWITFVEGDVFGPAWQPNYLVLTHPPVARYIIGAGLALQGWSPDELNGRYDTDRSRDFNRRAGNIPSRELLNDARNVVLLFAIVATLLLYPIGRSVGAALGWRPAGPLTGAVAVVLALAHPLLATVWTRALAESILAFFCLLAILLAIRLGAASGPYRRRFGLAVGLGVSVGLATATKLSGSLVAAGLVLYVAARQAVRLLQDRSLAGLGPWIDAGLAAVVIFVAVNPLLYPNPAWRSVLLFEHRRDEMEAQALGTPRLAIPNDVAVRAAMMYRRTFEDWGTFEARSGLPLDGPLAALGLGVVAFATWRSIRRREVLGPPALVLCWTLAVYVVSTVNFGFDSSHYVAPPATVAVLLQAVALAALATAAVRFVRRPIMKRPLEV
jgi:4-amino-4-deoxy-L-arabinose transferase-like glycosyltransferase